MTESAKTLVFVAAGIVSLLVGFVVGPTKDNFNVETLVGQRLNEFDIDEPKSLKIVRFDSDTAAVREFEVAEENGLWVIPSKQNYPADATRQMAEAATGIMDREILRIAATNASQHEALGVIDPTSANVETQSEGVGIRVSMQDNNKKNLTDMIIGKEDKDAEGQYFVRNANQDVVYVVNLDPDKLSTRFEDWIEDDLLKLNTFDISQVQIKDYSAELQFTLSGIRVNYDRRAEMVLNYDNSDSKWSAGSLKKFDPTTKSYTDVTLAEDEQLNEDALSDLKNGLDDLKIVDVERKPAGLSADLKAGEDFLKDNTAATSLIARGFAPLSAGPGGDAEILSSEGEVICSLDTGVEYVLRFGNLQLENDGEEAPAEDGADAKGEAINRYLFVMARFNKDLIKQPEIEELPALPAGMTEADVEEATAEENDNAAAKEGSEEAATTEESDSEASAEEAPADEEAAPIEEEEEEEEETPADATEVAADDASEAEESDAERPADTTEGTAPADDAETDSAPADEAASEESPSEEKPEEENAEEEEVDLAKIIAERKRIEKENQRKLDEYQKQIEDGKKTVEELNERFGDWYYVISNDVYQQIHLNLDKLIEKKEKPAEQEKTEEDPAAVPGLPNLNFQNAPVE